MIGLIIIVGLVGLLTGAIARLAVPGRQRISLLATTVIGILGSYVGGLVGYALHHDEGATFQPAGLVGSVLGAILVLVAYGRLNPDIHRSRRRRVWR